MIAEVLRSAVRTGIATAVIGLAASPAVAQRSQPRIVPNPGDPRVVDATSALPLVGELVPRFEVQLLNGKEVTADSLVGAPHVIAIWSTDCPGSRSALAAMQDLYADLSGRGIRFLILATDTSRSTLETFITERNVRLPVAQVTEDQLHGFKRSRRVAADEPYEVVFSKPSFIVADEHTFIVARQGGFLPEEFIQIVKSLFGGGSDTR